MNFTTKKIEETIEYVIRNFAYTTKTNAFDDTLVYGPIRVVCIHDGHFYDRPTNYKDKVGVFYNSTLIGNISYSFISNLLNELEKEYQDAQRLKDENAFNDLLK